jgi:iron complex outermembrane recepter protein
MQTSSRTQWVPGVRRYVRAALAPAYAGLAALALAAPGARASDAPAEADTAALEEIVVTAEKRAEDVQKVPISISAFTAAAMEQHQITGIAEIANYTPNLQFTAGSSGMSDSANFFIRGIGQDDFITTTEPGVGVYVDGVYLARVTGAALNLGEVERVEVLRGPQGTLFGRNTIGGAINVVTAEPSDDYKAKVSITGGNQGTFDGGFMVNGAIAPGKLDGSVSFLSHRTDGWGTNTYPGVAGDPDMGAAQNVAGRAQLLFTPTDRLKFLASFDLTQDRGTTVPIGLVSFTPTGVSTAYNLTAPLPIGAQYITRDPDHVQTDTPTRTRLNVRGGSFTATWKGDAVSFKSISSYRSQDGLTGGDYDGTPVPYLEQVVNFAQSQWSEELQAFGDAFGQRLKWLTGLYYFGEKGRFDSDVALQSQPVFIYTNSKTNSYAGFGQASYAITDALSLTAGARWTEDHKEIRAMTDFAGAILVPQTTKDASFSNFSPMGSLQYQFTGDLMAYASVTRGFRSGGFNGRPFSQLDLTSFAPETVTSYEVGVKSQWLDHRLQVNIDGYYADYRNMQVTATSHDAAGNFVDLVGNAAEAHIRGMELQIQAVPVAPLRLYGSLGLTYNDVKEYPSFSFGATQLPDASKVNATAGADYTLPSMPWVGATLGVDYDYRSGYYPQFSETAPSYVKGYGLLNARLAFTPRVGNWLFTLYAKNLTNKIYWTYGETAGTGDTTVAFFGPTRQWGATLTFRF